jgi:hypothetical protein
MHTHTYRGERVRGLRDVFAGLYVESHTPLRGNLHVCRMDVFMYVCIHTHCWALCGIPHTAARRPICIYVLHTYVHTCYVLTNPPIPSSRCKCFVFLRPVSILLHKRTKPSPPPCNALLNVITIYFCERGYPRVPPCKPLK